ncbi:hypothetical protein H7X87_01560 [Acetobacteraceae bacterium]|nr:hypothetical protein [Candidatus Parcubacteria bacterium]
MIAILIVVAILALLMLMGGAQAILFNPEDIDEEERPRNVQPRRAN